MIIFGKEETRRDFWKEEFNRFDFLLFDLTKATEEELFEEFDAQMHGKYFHPIEHFPDKIDQFLDALNRVIQHLLLKKNQFSLFSISLYIDQQRDLRRYDRIHF